MREKSPLSHVVRPFDHLRGRSIRLRRLPRSRRTASGTPIMVKSSSHRRKDKPAAAPRRGASAGPQRLTDRGPGVSMLPVFGQPGSLGPIARVQLYEQISDRIMEHIAGGAWQPGQRLPAERDLAAEFGVSRPSLREALGALQMLGLIETQHGSGSRVAPDAVAKLGRHASVGVLGLGVSPVAVLDARGVIEPTIAALAARHYAPDREIEVLLAKMSAARDWSKPAHRTVWSEADRMFHRRIAIHADNAILLATADTIAAVMNQPLWRLLRDNMLAVPGRIEASIEEHGRIFAAIRDGRADDASRFAAEHVRVVRDYMGLG